MKSEYYNHRQCQSLFGYAFDVHKRCGYKCQLCGCGGNQASDFDLWRQMTVEHIIGNSQGGYGAAIRNSLHERFPDLSEIVREDFARRLDYANTVTACQFCNSTTSRTINDKSMRDLIFEAEGTPEEVINKVIADLDEVLLKKREVAKWKITSVRKAFDEHIRQEVTNVPKMPEPDVESM